jgi:hypothetical protein
MSREHIDEAHLTVTEGLRDQQTPNIRVLGEAEIVVTQVFGPRGHNLVGLADVTFGGHPAVTVLVRVGDREGLVHLSPIHGDRRKAGFVDIAPGTKCELLCPVTREPLPNMGPVGDGTDAEYHGLYLTPRLDEGAMVCISDVWDHYHSRIVDDFELISAWAAEPE